MIGKTLLRGAFQLDNRTYVRYRAKMHDQEVVPPREIIARDRTLIRERLRDSLFAGGKIDRERLRWVLAADRADLYRSEGARNTSEYLAALFHISKWKAQRWIGAAYALEHLPHIAAALEAGSLSLDKTVELTRFATPDSEKKLVSWARGVTVGCIRERGDEAIKASRQDIENAHHNRELTWWWNDHSLFFEGSLPAEQGAALVQAVDRLAHELPEDPDSTPAIFEGHEAPSMSQRRAEALFLLATSGDGKETAKASVVVHVPVGALSHDQGNGVVDQGPVLDPELVRMLACDSRIQALLEDSFGHPVGNGFESRTPTESLRRMVLKRDGHTCTFAGCGMKRFLHLHHIEPWPKGPTDYWNLITVCSVHHSLVHKMGWSVSFEDGEVAWLRPRGIRFEPGPAPPDPPLEPERRKVLLAEAAAHFGLEMLVTALDPAYFSDRLRATA